MSKLAVSGKASTFGTPPIRRLPVLADFEFPLTTIFTDEGIEGHTMDYGPLGQGRASAYAVHDIYFHDLIGQNPLFTEAIWQQFRAKQRHLYN